MDNNDNITFEIQGGGSMTVPLSRIEAVGYEKDDYIGFRSCLIKPYVQIEGMDRVYVDASELVRIAGLFAEYLAEKFNK